jgi:putative ABC transport system permease protein
MSYLPFANIVHRKLRSTLCMLAVAIGIAMMVVMLSLSHGTLNEVAERMESVPAELLVMPKGENAIYAGGGYFGEAHAKLLQSMAIDGKPAVARVIPVFWLTAPVGGQKQRIFGVSRQDAAAVFGERGLVEGRLFDAEGRFERAVAQAIARQGGRNGGYDTEAMEADPVHAEAVESGLEVVIDRRLQRVANLKVGDHVPMLGKTFTVVGVVETGVAARAFVPIQTLRHIDAAGLYRCTMFLVRLTDPRQAEQVAAAIEREVPDTQAIEKSAYGRLLFEGFSQIYAFINIASGVALVVCFLFTLLTMYTLVLERTREIGILRSLGATRRYIVRLAIEESLMLCTGGTILGLALAVAAKYGIEFAMPLQTVEIEWRWVTLALGVGIVGGVGSAIYPGYRAAKLDPATALAFE